MSWKAEWENPDKYHQRWKNKVFDKIKGLLLTLKFPNKLGIEAPFLKMLQFIYCKYILKEFFFFFFKLLSHVSLFVFNIFLEVAKKCNINNSKKSHSVQFSSVQSLSRVDSLWTHESQHTRPPCPSPTPGVHSNSPP